MNVPIFSYASRGVLLLQPRDHHDVRIPVISSRQCLSSRRGNEESTTLAEFGKKSINRNDYLTQATSVMKNE